MKTLDILTDAEERAAIVFRALGNPARVRIVTELARRNACVTGDFVQALPLAQSTVSQHLKVLREAGIVQVGTMPNGDPCYCLEPGAMQWVIDFFAQVCGDECAVVGPEEGSRDC